MNKYSPQDEACVCCGESTKTIERIVMECQFTNPNLNGGKVYLPKAPGFIAEGSCNWSPVDISKSDEKK